MKLAVLSNKSHDFTTRCAEHYLSRWSVSAVLGQTENRPRKPDPAGALEIARQLNEPPERFIYLGDSAVDMKTAIGAGMYPVGALWGFRTREELEESGAAEVIERPLDLLGLLR